MMGKILLVTIIAIVLSVIAYWKDLKERMYKNYPLELDVKVKIDRELMNEKYQGLSSNEIGILNFSTGTDYEAFLRRGIKNELLITIVKGKEKERWIVYKGDATDWWIIYMMRGFFNKIETTEKEEEK